MEDELTKFEKVKHHLKENKKAYLIGGIAGAGCFTAGYLLRNPVINNVIDRDTLKQVVEEAANAATIVNNTVSPVITNNNHVENNLGRVSKIVRDVETGEEWAKIRYLAEQIAKEHGISYDSARTRISQHLHGLSDHVFDKKYEISGLRTDV